MTLLVTQSNINQQVTFTSKNATDATTYVGTIVGAISYVVAASFGDIVSYTAAVQKIDNTVGAANTLNYFLISLSNGQSTPTILPFANEWIANGSFSVIQNTTIYNFNIYDLKNQGVSALMTLLQANGFGAFQITDPAILELTSAQGSTTVISTTS